MNHESLLLHKMSIAASAELQVCILDQERTSHRSPDQSSWYIITGKDVPRQKEIADMLTGKATTGGSIVNVAALWGDFRSRSQYVSSQVRQNTLLEELPYFYNYQALTSTIVHACNRESNGGLVHL